MEGDHMGLLLDVLESHEPNKIEEAKTELSDEEDDFLY